MVVTLDTETVANVGCPVVSLTSELRSCFPSRICLRSTLH